MPSISLIIFFLILSCATDCLSCAPIASSGRRILHEPFFPQDPLSPSDPPSPSPSPPAPKPKYPFSASTSTPNPSPFFPTYPAPPPPPSPIAFASFPANISSLELPHTPSAKSSSKLVAAAVAAVISAAFVVAVSVFCYCRRKRSREFSDDKTFRSDNSSRHPPVVVETANRIPKLRTSSTSSEFLYLGTLVNSRGIDDRDDTHNNGIAGGGGGGTVSDPRRLDSPELRPLPPLSRQSNQSFRRNCGNEDVSSTADEEEEFYSPRVSLGGRESESGAGSGSRRVYDAVAAENFEGGSSRSSSSSYLSSTSGSPARSHSISLSPPVSSSPRRSKPKSPESVTVHAPPPPPPPRPRIWTAYVVDKAYSSSSSSPDRDLEKSLDGSPRKSDVSGKYLPSPTLTPAILSAAPNPDAESLRLWNAPGRNGHSPSLSLISSSPDRSSEGNPETPPRMSPGSEKNSVSSAPILLDRGLDRNPDASLRIWNPWVHNEQSPSSSLASLSPEKSPDASPRVANVVQNVQSPTRISNSAPKSLQVPVPPPPPPMPPQKYWETPNPSTSTVQPNSKPPPLTPPTRPFMFQNPTKLSPIQLQQTSETLEKIEEETPKPKLKPLHWDKVRASSDREMVWDHLRSSSFKLNEEMIESLFIVNTPQSKPKESTPRSVLPSPNQDNRVLDPKKSQNIAIALRALNVTVDEVCDALLEGNADTLGTELLESLLKMAPTKEEERKLKDFKEDSPIKLGPAEKFLKTVLDVPFAFKRLDAMLYMTNFETEVEYLKKSFQTLEVACEELRNSRLFLKLLEAVLKTGNRMNVGTNRGDAHAFKLDTLLKLVDVKGADGKTTLLHFVVQEIIRTEGARLSDNTRTPGSTLSEDVKCRKLGLEVVSGLSSELANVKKAAAMDSEVLSSDVYKLSRGIRNIEEVRRLNDTVGLGESGQRFSESMHKFMKMAEEEIIRIQAQESVALSLVKEITEYFHGNSAKEEAHPFRIFMVVRDFLNVLDRVCKEVGMINERTIVSSAHKFPVPVNPMMPQAIPVFPARKQCSSSDDESTS